ncbi:DUF6371 domain-containing protein [Formosa sp. S-31]|uniref:DUF6371 domain-containing protein n=1 Tax=Formosa sp. S-31 TaxID=2790949 RepID=UPI003EB89858
MSLVAKFCNHPIENPLLKYLRSTYGNTETEIVKELYHIGTSKHNGTIFWYINVYGKAQKAKVSFYDTNGKRTNKFKVPYKNEDGYYSCLFGEHLLGSKEHYSKPIILVESEKTAIVCAIRLPQYNWLAYGGINGLTDEKLKVLIGNQITIIPDMSRNAVSIMENKIDYLKSIDIDAKIWDMTNGKTDDQLKDEGWYNCDLEDFFRIFH